MPNEKTTLPEKRKEDERNSGTVDFALHTPQEREALLEISINPENTWEKKEGSENSLVRMGISALSVMLLLGVLSYSVFDLQRETQIPNTPSVRSVESMTLVPEIEVSDFYESSTIQQIKESAEKSVKGFMSARTPEESCQFIAGGDLRLSRMKEYYERPENSWPQGFSGIRKVVQNSIASIPYLVIFAEDSAGEIHQFVGVPCRDEILLDWECSVEYGELSKKEFFEKKPSDPIEMRFFVEKEQRRETNRQGGFLTGSFIRFTEPQLTNFQPTLGDEDRFDEERFILLTDLNHTTMFRAHLNEDQGLEWMLDFLSGSRIRQPLQLNMTWNEEFNCPDVISIKTIWWFDYEAIKLSDPNFDFGDGE
jgi:hypothetical protein